MPLMPEFELSALADELYEASEDDDLRLAELMRELPKETGDALCTSNLTNALQAFMYAFGYEPNIDISDLLLLQPSTMLLRGIVIEKVELAELVFGVRQRTENVPDWGIRRRKNACRILWRQGI